MLFVPYTRQGFFFSFFFSHPSPGIFSRAFGVSKQVQWEIEMLEWSRPCHINYHLLRARGAENTQGDSRCRIISLLFTYDTWRQYINISCLLSYTV